MSAIECEKCGRLCDCDDYPEGFYRSDDAEPSDEFYCQNCNEKE